MKKKSIYEKKSVERNWATAQFSCEKKKKIVFQPCNCIARERAGKKKLYCKRRARMASESVLQDGDCIAALV